MHKKNTTVDLDKNPNENSEIEMATTPRSPADEFEKAWQSLSDGMDTCPAFHTALESCLDFNNTMDEVVRIFELQYQHANPSSIDELTAVPAASTDLMRIKFILFYGRLLWTYRFWKNKFAAAVANADCVLPIVDHFLPREGSRYSVYRDWFVQYIYAAMHEVTYSIDFPSHLEPTKATLEAESAVQELVQDPMSLAGVQPYGIDHWWVNKRLMQYANAGRIGNREVIRRLRPGAQGEVVIVQDDNQGNRVLKLPKPIQGDGPFGNVVRAVTEGRHMSAMKELNIAQVHNIAGPAFPEKSLGDEAQLALIRQYMIDSGAIFVEMEYYDDGTLDNRIETREHQVLESEARVEHAVRWGRQIAHTLSQIHRKGRCHGDLKFSNCLMKGDTVLLSDFGLARDLVKGKHREGSGLGTPAFMAPEQLNGGTPSPRADNWSWCVMMYRMLAGVLPFDGAEAVSKIKSAQYTSPRDFNSAVDDLLEDLIHHCFALEAEKRPTAEQIVAKLDEWMEARGLKGGVAKYAWNPELVKNLVGTEFVFLLLKLSSFGPNTYLRLKQILSKHSCGIFRIYRTLGHYDVVIRTFISNSALDQLIDAVEDTDKETRPIAIVIPHKVSRTRLHWHWSKFPLRAGLDPAALVELEGFLEQENWYKLKVMKQSADNGLIRAVNELENIIFFVFVTETKIVQNRHAIIEIIQHTVSEESRKGRISHESIYEIASGPTLAIVKGEVTDYFEIGEIVKQLGEKLAASGCNTLTCMAADKRVIGGEELRAAEFTVRATTKLLRQMLPELPEYGDETWESLTRKDANTFNKLKGIEKIVCDHIITFGQRHFNYAKEWIEQLLAKRLFGEPILDQIFLRIGEIARSVRQFAQDLQIDLSDKKLEALLAEIAQSMSQEAGEALPQYMSHEFPEVERLVSKLQEKILKQEDNIEDEKLMQDILALDAKVWTLRRLSRIRLGKGGDNAHVRDNTK